MLFVLKTWQSLYINEKWYSERKDNVEDESECIVKTAVQLIQAQIREAEDCTQVMLKSTISVQAEYMFRSSYKFSYFIRIEAGQYWSVYCTGSTATISNDAYSIWLKLIMILAYITIVKVRVFY